MQIGKHDITLSNIGIWPWSVKIASYVVIVLLFSALFYFFDTSNQLSTLTKVKQKESRLKSNLEQKHHIAANLDAYKQQLAVVQTAFERILEQLPSKNQMHDLLDQITQASNASGLQLVTLVPQAEQVKDFYAIYPIQITVTGNYHQMGAFVTKLARLNRIVVPDGYTINASKKEKKANLAGERLTMAMQLNTYRYIAPKAVLPKKDNK